ncbi:hypothetical protein [Bradyrhizobium sp. LMTR 3]|nr:hypothetical protein [Bradyrhizobium sp. LMTR 3]
MKYHEEFFWMTRRAWFRAAEIVKVCSLGPREKDGLELIAPLHRH